MSELIHERAIEKMAANRQRKLDGGVNCIQNTYERFSNFWPGVEKGQYYIVTASSGVGKSKFAKKTFVFDVVDQVMNHPEWNIDLHIKYFCLEESKVNFMQSLMSYKMYQDKPWGAGDVYWGFDPYRFDEDGTRKAIRWVLDYFGLPINP